MTNLNTELTTALTQAIAQTATLDTAFSVAVCHICQAINWNYGEVWITEVGDQLIKLSPIECINTPDTAHALALKQFQECSQSLLLQPGEGLPGRVWLSRQPEWISDVTAHSEAYFLRHQIAKAFGVKAGLGVPILVNDSVQAIFVFFRLEACAEDRVLIELLQTAATQIGTLLSRSNLEQ